MKRYTLLTLAILTFGCNSGRMEKLERESSELKAQLLEMRARVDFDLQDKCNGKAKALFKERWLPDGKNTYSLEFSNHYNRSLGKCLLLVEQTVFYDSLRPQLKLFSHRWLYDVLENRLQACYQDELTLCEVDGKRCSSLQDFETRIRHYMAD